MLSSFEFSILIPALAAGMLVLATHVPLGIEVLKRGIIFIDLAIAQVAGLGALVAILYFGEDANILWVEACSLLAALGGALLLTLTEKYLPEIQEALIGCLFVFSASLALLLLGQNAHGGEHMKDMLAGQILWVSTQQLLVVGVVYAMLLLLWFFTKIRQSKSGFYLIFAVMVTASVQLVGVYMVFASLILPALASRHAKKRLTFAYAIGLAGLLVGLVLSSIYDFSTGPAIVCTSFAFSILCLFFKRRA